MNSGQLLGILVAFCPGDSLVRQLGAWRARNRQYQWRVCSAGSPGDVHLALSEAIAAVVDATSDPGRALQAFQEAVGQLGASSVAVYTETMHAGLELSVRTRGAQLLLGPLGDVEWDAFFRKCLNPDHGPRTSAANRHANHHGEPAD